MRIFYTLEKSDKISGSHIDVPSIKSRTTEAELRLVEEMILDRFLKLKVPVTNIHIYDYKEIA